MGKHSKASSSPFPTRSLNIWKPPRLRKRDYAPCRQLCLLFPLLWAFAGCKVRVCAQCRAEQRDALLRLKQGFTTVSSFQNNTSSVVLPSWNPTTDCCQGWKGVTCDPSTGMVSTLDISQSNITKGKLHQALFNLTSLRVLNLSCNQFDPDALLSFGFERLSSLTHLNLSDSGFVGQIPAGISRLTRLVSLDFSAYGRCSISSPSLHNPDLKRLIGNLTNLEQLYLSGVNISAGGLQWGPALASSVPALRELDLSSCSLSGPIDSSFSKLTNLTIVRLNGNNLSSVIPEFFGNFSSLSILRLGFCALSGPIPGNIFKLPRLRNLDVSRNPMLHGHLPDFPADNVIENLLLFGTGLSGSLPASIGNLRLLKTLHLYSCNFAGSLPASFSNLKQLVSVDLSNNNFDGPIPSFASATNLTVLNLQNNSLTGPVPGWLFRLPTLQTLQLNLNQLSGALEEFSDGASLLETLDLSSNNLQGSFPKSLAKLPHVRILKLSSNRLYGTVELNMFANLKNLYVLDLSSNNLRVAEATSSPSFPSIATLNLASCSLIRFPNLLRSQSTLSRLDLSDNLIQGVIPDWLWRVSNNTLAHLNISHNSLTDFENPPDLSGTILNILDISSNKLRGQIPLLPTSSMLSFVDYSNNQFTSSLPPDIGFKLPFTLFFSVSNNILTGQIPSSFCNSTFLQVLDLSTNRFSGKIPECLFAVVNDLRVLNLRGNRLTGSLPAVFAGGCSLRTLNVNGNRLAGGIPPSLSNCTMLQVLDLGNNQMEDSFPSWLSNLTDLRVLVLRSNKFHGVFPVPQGDTSFFKLQILDISSNRFSGPLPAMCFRSWKAMMTPDGQSDSFVGKFGYLELSHLYYQDTVTVTVKGRERTLVKILRMFTSIDMSHNLFKGTIPEAVGELRALRLLNMSSNGLTGSIPSSIGNLAVLESLDLSNNSLSGAIPASLAKLTFLSTLNLSNNNLVGPIPQSGQLATFSNAAFAGNEGLCWPPLSERCSDAAAEGAETVDASAASPTSESNLDIIIPLELGFIAGVALVIWLLMFWSEGRRWLYGQVDRQLWPKLPCYPMTRPRCAVRGKIRTVSECRATQGYRGERPR